MLGTAKILFILFNRLLPLAVLKFFEFNFIIVAMANIQMPTTSIHVIIGLFVIVNFNVINFGL